jgi:hypothetical protein
MGNWLEGKAWRSACGKVVNSLWEGANGLALWLLVAKATDSPDHGLRRSTIRRRLHSTTEVLSVP